MRKRIDLNSDVGEGFGPYSMGCDEQLIKYITSANVACGFHAGDPMWMRRTVQLAEQHNVAIGAHPSFPDLQGFGRRNMVLTSEEIKNYLTYQIGALTPFTSNRKLQHVKPHGAMYNMATTDQDLAKAICEAILDIDQNIILIVLAGTHWAHIAQEMGLRVAKETFAHRALNSDGTLVTRSNPNAIIEEKQAVIERSIQIATEGKITAITGEEIPIDADTLCIHGDTPNSSDLARSIRLSLETANVDVLPLSKLV